LAGSKRNGADGDFRDRGIAVAAPRGFVSLRGNQFFRHAFDCAIFSGYAATS
jgi:hypothetical protein